MDDGKIKDGAAGDMNEAGMPAGVDARAVDQNGAGRAGAAQEAAVRDKQDTKKRETACDKLRAELDEALAERDDFKDRYLRTFSDFNNYKKRVENARIESLRDGRCDAIEQLLPVLDSFEHALGHCEGDDGALAKGITMLHKQLIEGIEKMGIKEIPALGEPFDPTRHQAVQMVEPQEDGASGAVAAVLQKGYMTDERVIRPSMVIVNK